MVFSHLQGLHNKEIKQQTRKAFLLQIAMEKADIMLDTRYPHPHVQDALSKVFGEAVAVHCEDGMVSEVWMCLKHDLQPFSCPRNVQRGCKSVVFPSWPDDPELQLQGLQSDPQS
jgi:ribonuclease I